LRKDTVKSQELCYIDQKSIAENSMTTIVLDNMLATNFVIHKLACAQL